MSQCSVRCCKDEDFETIWNIINNGARAYRGSVPEDCLRDPYMSIEELRFEMTDGVVFWGCEEDGELQAVMGIQEVGDVTLIRHAYVRTGRQKQGMGSQLLRHLLGMTARPVLIGTWKAAVWAIRFYEHYGFRVVEWQEKERLLRTYWKIPERQIETSVVLANERWRNRI